MLSKKCSVSLACIYTPGEGRRTGGPVPEDTLVKTGNRVGRGAARMVRIGNAEGVRGKDW